MKKNLFHLFVGSLLFATLLAFSDSLFSRQVNLGIANDVIIKVSKPKNGDRVFWSTTNQIGFIEGSVSTVLPSSLKLPSYITDIAALNDDSLIVAGIGSISLVSPGTAQSKNLESLKYQGKEIEIRYLAGLKVEEGGFYAFNQFELMKLDDKFNVLEYHDFSHILNKQAIGSFTKIDEGEFLIISERGDIFHVIDEKETLVGKTHDYFQKRAEALSFNGIYVEEHKKVVFSGLFGLATFDVITKEIKVLSKSIFFRSIGLNKKESLFFGEESMVLNHESFTLEKIFPNINSTVISGSIDNGVYYLGTESDGLLYSDDELKHIKIPGYNYRGGALYGVANEGNDYILSQGSYSLNGNFKHSQVLDGFVVDHEFFDGGMAVVNNTELMVIEGDDVYKVKLNHDFPIQLSKSKNLLIISYQNAKPDGWDLKSKKYVSRESLVNDHPKITGGEGFFYYTNPITGYTYYSKRFSSLYIYNDDDVKVDQITINSDKMVLLSNLFISNDHIYFLYEDKKAFKIDLDTNIPKNIDTFVSGVRCIYEDEKRWVEIGQNGDVYIRVGDQTKLSNIIEMMGQESMNIFNTCSFDKNTNLLSIFTSNGKYEINIYDFLYSNLGFLRPVSASSPNLFKDGITFNPNDNKLATFETNAFRELNNVALKYKVNSGPVQVASERNGVFTVDLSSIPYGSGDVSLWFSDVLNNREFPGREFKYQSLKPWFFTIWGMCLIAFISTVIFFLIFKYLKRRLIQKNEVLLAKHKEVALNTLSHEIKSPLKALGLAVDLYNEDAIDQKEALDRMSKYINQLNSISSNMLTTREMFNKERMAVEVQNFNLTQTVDEIVLIHKETAALKHVNIDVKTDIAGDLRIMSDKGRIAQCLNNLINNAVKYSNVEGTVTLEWGYDIDNKAIYFSVEDNGPGIPEKDIDRIFEQYQQADNTVKEGLGIGLFVVKGIIDKLNGFIKVESKVNDFTRFYFQIPALVKFGANEVEIERVKRAATIAHLDDDIIISKSYKIQLERLGFEVTAFNTADEVLSVDLSKFDGFITDHFLSDHSYTGLDVLKDKISELKGKTIFALSHQYNEDVYNEYLSLGAIYLNKDDKTENILDRIVQAFKK